MTGRRPRESAKYPASGDAINASKDVLLVIADRSKVDNGRPKSSCIETRVELMTPVLSEDSVNLWHAPGNPSVLTHNRTVDH
jgi:hypothetical protein